MNWSAHSIIGFMERGSRGTPSAYRHLPLLQGRAIKIFTISVEASHSRESGKQSFTPVNPVHGVVSLDSRSESGMTTRNGVWTFKILRASIEGLSSPVPSQWVEIQAERCVRRSARREDST